MSDLGHDVAAKLLAIKEKKDQELAALDASQNTQAAESVPDVPHETPSAEAVPEKVEKVETTEKPAEEPQTTEVIPAESEDLAWDADLVEPDTKTEQIPGVDIKKLGSALNLEVSTEEELVKTVSEKLAKLKEAEETSKNIFEGVPNELKEAIEVAKKGGDWYTFIEHSLLDVTKLDPIDLFEQEYERQEAHKYKNSDGTIDYERLDEALDAIPDALKTMQGNTIKNNLYLQQQQKKQQVQAQSQQAQEAFKLQVSDAMKELPTYFPKDTFGITVESKHVSSLYDGIATNKLVQKHLGITDPSVLAKIDPKKLVRTLAMAEWSAGISKAQYNRGVVNAKRELLEKTQNAQVRTSSIPATPEVGDSDKVKSPAQLLAEALRGAKPQGSL
jgi:hypothetical protein